MSDPRAPLGGDTAARGDMAAGGARPPATLPVAVALLAGAGLVLEIALTRVLSLLYFSPFVYVLLAVAVLGLGLGAALATLWPASRGAVGRSSSAAAAALATPALIGATLALATTPYRGVALALVTLPFLGLGHALSSVFATRAASAPRLYFADLVGAGLGAAAAAPVLDALGGVGAGLAAGALAGAAALLLAPPTRRAVPAATALVAVLVLATQAVLGVPQPPLARLHAPKPLQRQLASGARPVAHRWDAVGRSDLVRRPDGSLYLYLDGGAGSLVADPTTPERWLHDIGAFAFAAVRPQRAFVIGPGGGLDVALARHFLVPDITAVELNGAAVALADEATRRGLLGGTPVYGPPVEVRIDDGRAALRRSAQRYDLVLLSQVVTDAAEARSYALAENTLYTVEAMGEALDHLTPDGAVAMKLYDELTLTRALTTALTALGRRGAGPAEASRHLLAVLDARGDRPIPLLMVFARPLERDAAVDVARLAEGAGLNLLFVPGLLEPPPLDAVASGRESVAQLIAASTDADIAPVRDARPFFFEFERGLPHALRPLLRFLALGALLAAAALAVRQRRVAGPARAAPLLFALLGAGFMLLEVAALQRLRLYLGHPTLALSVGLGALLVGAGIGSAYAGRRDRGGASSWRLAGGAALAVAALGTAWALLFPELADLTLAAPAALRATLAALSLAPLAVPLGMPFPLALRAVGRRGATEVALAWTVNGVSSVLGSSAATAIALLWGYPWVSWAGVGAYLLAAAAARALATRERAAAAAPRPG